MKNDFCILKRLLNEELQNIKYEKFEMFLKYFVIVLLPSVCTLYQLYFSCYCTVQHVGTEL